MEGEMAVAVLSIDAPRDAHERENHKALVKDSIGYLLSRIIPGFFSMVSVPVFVRLIGIEEYGRLAVILPILMALGGAASGWLQQGILRFHPPSEGSADGNSPFSRAILVGTVYGVLALGLALIPILALLHYTPAVWAIAGSYVALQLIYLVSLTRLQAQLRPRAVIRNEALRSFAGFVLPVCLVLALGRKWFPLVILGLALGYLLPLLFRSGGQIVPASIQGRAPNSANHSQGTNSQAILGKLWRFGWAVGIWLMLIQVFPVIGRSAIQKYSGYAQAGIYASLYELAVRSFSLFASPVMQAAHPRIMRYWNQGSYDAARSTIRHSIRIQILMFLPFEAVGVIFSRPITRLILGPGNSAPASLLPLLMLGGFLWQIALFVHKPLEIMQRTQAMLAGMLAVLAIEFAGNYLLVPRFGMQAAVAVFVLGAMAYIAFAAFCGRVPLHPASGEFVEANI
jgi:O-antigen/teichoic acid export membrane protein